jgi:glycosyltransferase involved in cell wall biosynthesis
VPVVAFAVGGVAEVLDGGPATRLVRPSGDVLAFREALDDLLAGTEQIAPDLHRWSESVRARFSVQATGAASARLYSQVVENTAVPKEALPEEQRPKGP